MPHIDPPLETEDVGDGGFDSVLPDSRPEPDPDVDEMSDEEVRRRLKDLLG